MDEFQTADEEPCVHCRAGDHGDCTENYCTCDCAAAIASAGDLATRKSNMERIIRASWKAGYEAGRSGLHPEVEIIWDGLKPRIELHHAGPIARVLPEALS